MKKRTNKKGFTLVELLVVIAILAILASVSVIGYVGFTEKARKSVDEQLCTQYNNLIKAETAGHENEPLTLGNLVILIEENGIHANKFMTSSKAYTFAYNEEAKEVVLVEDGKVAYPSGKTYSADKLWATYTGQFIEGIKNYTLFEAHTYSDPVNTTNLPSEITVDLNNNNLAFSSAPKIKINLINGSILQNYDDKESKKLNADPETVTVLGTKGGTDDKKWGAISVDDTAVKESMKKAAVVDTSAPTAVKVELKEQYFAPAAEAKNGKIGLTLTADNIKEISGQEAKNVKVITFKDTTFVNFTLSANVVEGISYVFENCKFLNTQSYVAHFQNYKDLTLKNCHIQGSNRGINLFLGSGTTIIENCTFDIITKETNKSEVKANAMQLVVNDKMFNVTRSEVETTDIPENNKMTNVAPANTTFNTNSKLIVRNNKMIHGLALVTLHSTAVNQNSKIRELFETALDNPNFLVFENNKLESGVIKFTLDPGLEKDQDGWINSTELSGSNLTSRYSYHDGLTKLTEGDKVAQKTYYERVGQKIAAKIK